MEASTALLTDQVPLAGPAEPRAERVRLGLLRRVGAGRLALAVLGIAIVAGLGYLRAWPPVATVMSGSMAPTIETGDVVVMKRIDGAPKVGDVVAVNVPDEARSRYGYPPQVIHRVVSVGADGRIVTKGDARRENDPFTVARAAVETEVVTTLPAAGRALAFMTSTLGLLWLGLGALLLIVMPLLDRQRELQRRGEGEIEEIGEDLQVVLEEVVRLRAAVDAMHVELRSLPVAVEPEPEAPESPAPEPSPVPEPEPQAAEEPRVGVRRSGGLVGRAQRWLG